MASGDSVHQIWIINAQRCKRLYFEALHRLGIMGDFMVVPQQVEIAMN